MHEQSYSSDGTALPSNDQGLGVSLRDVFDDWRTEGPLVHEPTGIPTLDEITGGGPVYGTRWFISGAPDAGKTALLVANIAATYAERGLWVGILAVDEEAGDVAQRFAQRAGLSRRHCEERDEWLFERLERVPVLDRIRLYGPEVTIEEAAADVARRAELDGVGAMLAVDSIQTVTCNAICKAEREMAEHQSVTANAFAMRNVAKKHRLIAIATSEMSRSGYASNDAKSNTNDMAVSKWSGSIEYQARVLLTLRSVPGESNLTALRLPKNKHRPAGTALPHDHTIYLRLSRDTQRMREETDYQPADGSERQAEKDARHVRQRSDDAAWLAVALARRPGPLTGELHAVVGSVSPSGIGKPRISTARAYLGAAVVVVPGERKAKHLYLDGSKLPEDVLGLVPSEHRNAVITARPVLPMQEAS